jgi:hypothetical protein
LAYGRVEEKVRDDWYEFFVFLYILFIV